MAMIPRIKAKTLAVAVLIAFVLTLPMGQAGTGNNNAKSIGLPLLVNEAYADAGTMTIDVRNVDMRDVLSALAIKMGVDIILIDDKPVEITLKAENITPLYAIELIIQKQGLNYLRDGGIIVIGDSGTLEKYFFNQMILTRFDTQNIESDKLKQMISELGLDGVKTINTDTNPHVIWVQGTGQALKKVRELINAVDIEKPAEEELMTRFVYKLKYIVAMDAAERLQMFGFEDVSTIYTDNDRYGKELMIICPKDIAGQVRSALTSLDAPREKTRAPLLKGTGNYAHQAINSVRDLLSQLSGVSIASMTISRNVGTPDEPVYILWVEETPDKVRLLRDLIDEMGLDDISSDKEEDKDDD